MSKFDDAVGKYKEALSGAGKKSAMDEALLTKVAKSLGPSIYLKDASLVSCTDQAEMDRVKNNFLIKKLGMKDGANLDAAIKSVCEQYASNQRYRAVFYYLLVKQLGKESMFA
jgi:hypothetical protein